VLLHGHVSADYEKGGEVKWEGKRRGPIAAEFCALIEAAFQGELSDKRHLTIFLIGNIHRHEIERS
jgi:hypothetical protein